MNTWKEINALSGDALTAEFARLISESAKVLPIVGKLRHRSKIVANDKDGAPLAKARESALKMGASTSCVDNAASHERVFALFHLALTRKDKSPLLSEELYDSLTYAQARTLSEAIGVMRDSVSAHSAVVKYLSGPCKFGTGWADHVLKTANKAAGIVATVTPAPTDTPTTTPDATTGTDAPTGDAPPVNVTVMPAPTKCANATEATARVMDALRAACDGLSAKQIAVVRANLARACNSEEAFTLAIAA